MEYPKINSLYKREEKTKKLIIGDFACEEFACIKHWTVTEKVDGTNIRIIYKADPYGALSLYFGGRTSNAQIPADLYAHLQKTFTLEKMRGAFKNAFEVILFGEGYGPRIQSGGYYLPEVSFILFDAFIDGWWLERSKVYALSLDLKIDDVPLLPFPNLATGAQNLWNLNEIEEYIKMEPFSKVALVEKRVMEGIVARSHPLMLFRDGKPVMFKLKCKDFHGT
jgi:RNA ligase